MNECVCVCVRKGSFNMCCDEKRRRERRSDTCAVLDVCITFSPGPYRYQAQHLNDLHHQTKHAYLVLANVCVTDRATSVLHGFLKVCLRDAGHFVNILLHCIWVICTPPLPECECDSNRCVVMSVDCFVLIQPLLPSALLISRLKHSSEAGRWCLTKIRRW